jgi:site-specific DNA recombinase
MEDACHTGAMARSQKSRRQRAASFGAIPDDLYGYARPAARRRGRPIKDDQTTWTVTERAEGAIERTGPNITPQSLKTFAGQARRRMRTHSGGYRRDHLRALAQRVEVDAKEVRIMGSKIELLRTLVAASSAKTAGFGVPSFVPKWRARRDSNSDHNSSPILPQPPHQHAR